MLILVTGATGFIASRLIPQLLKRGHQIRALARDPRRLDGKAWAGAIEIIKGDVMLPSTLPAALRDVHTAYYLIHSMESGHGYTARDLEGARNFAGAAAAAGVHHIVYLGGLADPEQHIAPHMRARVATGTTLRQGPVPVTEFRAGVIAGLGSTSFEMIRRITELFPIIPGPSWLRHKTQPIAASNVVDYLLAALDSPKGKGKVFEIGGPEVTTYADLMLRYARVRGLRRGMVLIPGLPVWLMALGIGLLTPVPHATAAALVRGLSSDSVVIRSDASRVFPEIQLTDFASATRDALVQLRAHSARTENAATGRWKSAMQRVAGFGTAMRGG